MFMSFFLHYKTPVLAILFLNIRIFQFRFILKDSSHSANHYVKVVPWLTTLLTPCLFLKPFDNNFRDFYPRDQFKEKETEEDLFYQAFRAIKVKLI